MKSFHLTLSVLIAAALGTAAAWADDPHEIFKQAQEAQLNAPAMRMTVDSVNNATKKKTTMIIEIVNPDGMHSKMMVDGKIANEMISDGQKTLMRRGEGAFQPMPVNMSQMIMNARKTALAEGLADTVTDFQLVGHEDVNGAPASIYTYKTEVMGLARTGKMWIGDKDHLPLKSEAHSEGVMKAGGGPGVKVDRDSSVTFEYDPSIKIVLPGN